MPQAPRTEPVNVKFRTYWEMKFPIYNRLPFSKLAGLAGLWKTAHLYMVYLLEGSLAVKLPTCSNSCEKSQRRVREESEKRVSKYFVVEKQCGTVSWGNMPTSRWHLTYRLIDLS